MEVYTHRSRSRSHHHHHHHPSSASSFSHSSSTKRSYNVTEKRFAASSDVDVSASATSGTQMHPFAPRDEDYSVVFGSFLSSRASSIPMLDLPSFIDEDDEVSVSAGFDYSQVFGGLEFDRFGLTCDDLFLIPECVEDSAADDESSSPARSNSIVSVESSNSSVIDSEQNNPKLVSRAGYQSPDQSEGSSNNTCQSHHITRDGEFKRCSLGTADDIILKEDSSGNVSVETLSKSSSSPSHSQNGKHSSSPSHSQNGKHSSSPSHSQNGKHTSCESNAGGRRNGVNNYFMEQISVSVSDIHVGTNGLPVCPLRPPHVSVNNLEDDDLRRFVAYERIDESGSPPGFCDVEVVDRSPSARNSGETEKKPKRRAQVKMKTFKDFMKRKKDGGGVLNGKNHVHNDSDTTISGRSNVKSSSENEDYYSPGDRRMTSGSAVKKHARRRNVNNDYDFLGPGTMVGENKWKEGSQYVELTNNINFREGPNNLPLHSLKRGNCYPFAVDGIGKPMEFKLQEERGGGGTGRASYNSPEVNEGEHLDNLFEPRASQQTASGAEFHEGMGNVALYNHDEVTYDVENNVAAALSSSSEKRMHQIFLSAAHAEKKESDGVEEEKRRKEVNSGEENGTRVLKKDPATTYGNGRVAEADESNDKDEEDCVTIGKRRGEEAHLRHENGTRVNGAFEMDGARLGASGESQEGTMGIKEESVDEETRVDLKGSCEKDRKKNQEMKLQEKVNEEVTAIEDGQLEKSQQKQVDSAHHQFAAERKTVNGNKFEISRAEGMEGSSESACCELWKTNKIGDNTDENEEIKIIDCLHISGYENQVNESQTHPRTKLHVKAEKGMSKPAEVVVLCEGDQQASSNAPADQPLRKDTDEVKSQPMDVENGSKAASEIGTTQGMQPEQVHRAEAHEPTTVHVPFPRRSQSLKTRQVVSGSSYSNNLTAGEERERSETQERAKREFEEDHLRKLEEERERERARRALEEEHLRKLEEERERAERLERGRRAFEEEHLKKLEEEREKERERTERMERARRAYEEEHLRKLEEEREREREREKDRMKVELEIDDGRRRALAEARERAAVERATAEARQRVMTEARERLEKACADARGVSLAADHNQTAYSDQTAACRLRAAERAAVERATAEARERAFEKAKAERAAYEARELLKRSISDKFSGTRHYYPLSYDTRNCGGVEGENDERCNARLQRHRRTAERVAEALAEKNKRDLIAQREQAERNRLAVSLNADIKRWSNGKEGNLRALLSTLQHILGPDSGWQPISLTEILTPTAAKKAYRKATLCVHPDKLQQRGATIQQKYICEKVFDLLKDAWNKFNSGES